MSHRIGIRRSDVRHTTVSRPRRKPNRRAGNPSRTANQQLLQALIRAYGWVKQLEEGQHQSVESLGQAIGLHPKVIRNGIRLAFLEPGITKAILQGEWLPELGLRDFIGPIALSWFEQRDQYLPS